MNKWLIIFVFAVALAITGAILYGNWKSGVENGRINDDYKEAIEQTVQAIDEVNANIEDKTSLKEAMDRLLKAQAELLQVQYNVTKKTSSGGGGRVYSGGGGY